VRNTGRSARHFFVTWETPAKFFIWRLEQISASGPSWEHFGCFGVIFQVLFGPWGHFGGTLDALWAHFGDQKTDWGAKGAPRGATTEIKSPIWIPFGTYFHVFSHKLCKKMCLKNVVAFFYDFGSH